MPPRASSTWLVCMDFRMTSTGLLADVVLPAATWYEKDDLSSTDMHPFVHSFTPAIAPPWQARTDYDTFLTIADRFSELAAEHLGTRTDVLAVPLQHDTREELAQPGGTVRDFTRLVHVWSVPIGYLARPYLVYRRRLTPAVGSTAPLHTRPPRPGQRTA